ncbi:hypothetical protein SO574_23510 (plasmid) [Vibrio alfacsensis]|uniref:hypothetical protein n=1 Tax=Vibrio alfacsensis TaxID=1074311 RepID=UPI002ADE0B12|nr:hypothetical protein [Vibrio alfacsensis]WQE79442.1 hypothetical protein SO574_23510 [Vibrio alfacsensis]
MQLAKRAVLESVKALKQHRQQHPARYERVIEREGVWWRYYSEVPATLYGERLLAHFDLSTGDPIGRLLYAEKLDDSHWYMASFTPSLEQEAVGTLATLVHSFGYALHHAQTVWFTDASLMRHMDQDARFVEVAVPDKAVLLDYELTAKTKSKWVPIALGVGLTLCLSVIGGVWMMQLTAPPPKVVAPIDTAKLLYEQSWTSKVNARDALLSGRNLLVQASMMPTGMKANTVILEGQTLTLTVKKENVTRAMERAWLRHTPSLSSLYQSTGATLASIAQPLSPLPPWQGYALNGYRMGLMDALERLGATVTEQGEQQIEGTTIHTLFVELANAPIGQVGIVADLVNAPFVVLSQLDMEMNEQYQLSRLNFTLDVQGD